MKCHRLATGVHRENTENYKCDYENVFIKVLLVQVGGKNNLEDIYNQYSIAKYK